MKCPACGFESADDAGWCDFCKEPFRKHPAPLPEASPHSPPPPQAAPAPEHPWRSGAPAVGDLKGLDAGERIPAVAPWVRWTAWAFLGLWFFWGMILIGFYLGKQRVAEEERRAPPAQQAP